MRRKHSYSVLFFKKFITNFAKKKENCDERRICLVKSKGGMTMNKNELVSSIAQKSGLTKKDVESVVTGVLDEITSALASGEKVQFVGFGTFEPRQRSSRTGRNPQTGKSINIPATVVPAFKAGNKLKDAVK